MSCPISSVLEVHGALQYSWRSAVHPCASSLSRLVGLQERPRLEAAVQLHGGTISPSSQQESGDKSRVLIVTDMQKADLASAPPNATNLHITTVDHVLVSPTSVASRTFVVPLTVIICISAMGLASDACPPSRHGDTNVFMLALCVGGHIAQRHIRHDNASARRGAANCTRPASFKQEEDSLW